MSKILKWLEEHNISYTIEKMKSVKADRIRIVLEKDCVWINGFGQPMKYDKEITIVKSTSYGTYYMQEVTGMSLSKSLCTTTKQTDIITALEKRFL